MKQSFLLSLLVCVVFWANSQDQGIFFSPSIWNVGTIGDQEQVSASFSIRNSLPYPVKLLQVETSCSCNAVFELPPSLMAKEEKKFILGLNPHGKMGKYVWEICVHTDSPDVPVVKLPIHAVVLRDAFLSQTSLRFKEFFMGQTVEERIYMAYKEKPDFRILSAVSTCPEFTVQVKPGKVEGFYQVTDGFTIIVSAKKEIQPGPKQGEIVINTDLPNHSIVRIPLIAYVNGYLRVAPHYLSFGLLKPGNRVAKIIRVSHNKIGTAFEILKVSSSLPEVETKVLPLVEKYCYQIEVTWNVSVDASSEEKRGIVKIQTNVPFQTDFEIPIQAIIHAGVK